ncbi:hypothetical protein CVT24_010640 [Panaeolus cyanescens]|uniref:N-acetyltransferase domain-containing protein n=1 Tax=Panaeolus cyanescens TaxID=181874 RepID=A0A409YM19_9AGAR|nr:hypothetical protein CVT24_010640 [Panaeolus cyanescens]
MISQYQALKDSDAIVDVEYADLPIPVPLQRDIPKAAQTYCDAFRDDPMINYLDAGRRSNERLRKFYVSTILRVHRYSHILSTIDHGVAISSAKPAHFKPKTADKLLDCFVQLTQHVGRSKEQRKRLKEYNTKMKKALEETPELGENIKDMILVELLATSPESQGHGYGTALLSALTLIADVLRQKSWLTSSNIKNTAFYNSHGFVTVKDIILGDDNPCWEGSPIVVKLMVRNPRVLPRPWQEDEKNPFLDSNSLECT